MTCTFFGHSDAPSGLLPQIEEAVRNLIQNHGVDKFYVGNQGNFDAMVKDVLVKLKCEYPYIQYAVVLAYLMTAKDKYGYFDCSDTIFPEGIENGPPKFAIDRRNKWMIENCDYAVTYVVRGFGGAANFKALAKRKKKLVIELSNT